MGLISGFFMGMIFGISLMAGWRHMMRYRSTKRVAKAADVKILGSLNRDDLKKRRSRAYQWKRPTIFLKEGDSIPPDVDPDTVRWIPANHPFATTASDIDEDLAQNNVYQKHSVPFRIQAEHEAHQKKLKALQNSSYGFVHYFDRRSAAMAILSLNGRHLFGQPIKVNWAYASGQREDTSGHFNIFVGDLSPEVTDATLYACFSVYPNYS